MHHERANHLAQLCMRCLPTQHPSEMALTNGADRLRRHACKCTWLTGLALGSRTSPVGADRLQRHVCRCTWLTGLALGSRTSPVGADHLQRHACRCIWLTGLAPAAAVLAASCTPLSAAVVSETAAGTVLAPAAAAAAAARAAVAVVQRSQACQQIYTCTQTRRSFSVMECRQNLVRCSQPNCNKDPCALHPSKITPTALMSSR